MQLKQQLTNDTEGIQTNEVSEIVQDCKQVIIPIDQFEFSSNGSLHLIVGNDVVEVENDVVKRNLSWRYYYTFFGS